MCKSFEKVSGKKVEGNVGMLNGLTKVAKDINLNVTILRIPVTMMDIDTRYQTEVRTKRQLGYLVNNWNENKLLPVIGVPHWEEGKVYLVDGYGRWIASQMVDKEKYKDLEVQLILNAPTDADERLEFEADLFAYQNKNVAKLKPVHSHGARLCLHDKPTIETEEKRKKYGFEISGQGRLGKSKVAYSEMKNVCSINGCTDFVLEICKEAGFDRKTDGLSSYVLRGLKDIYINYPKQRSKAIKYLGSELRKIAPKYLKAEAVTKYPTLDSRTAVSLFIEDCFSEHFKVAKARKVVNGKVTPVEFAEDENIFAS